VEVMLTNTPAPLVPSNLSDFSLEDLDPLEVARQFCLVEQELYRAIQPRECLNQAWSHKTQKETAAPNILALIRRSNRVSCWVTTRIVYKEDLNDRIALVKRFISIAQCCREFHNLNGVMEILAGLSASPIHRLKHTWLGLDPKTTTVLNEMKKDMHTNNNSANMRNILHREDPPSIPYLGIYLTDLTFIEDGNLDRWPDGLINFSKRKRLSSLIKEIQQYQQPPYNFSVVPEIFNFVRNVTGQNEDKCYLQSLICEPKREGERRSSRSLSPSVRSELIANNMALQPAH